MYVLFVGYNGTGTYNLGGNGLLAAAQDYIGNSAGGSFQQTGGTNTATHVNLSGGSYQLSGGLLQVNCELETAGGTLNCGGGSAGTMYPWSPAIQANNSIVEPHGQHRYYRIHVALRRTQLAS